MEHGLKGLRFMFKAYSSSSSLVITSRWFATSRVVAPVSVRLVYWSHELPLANVVVCRVLRMPITFSALKETQASLSISIIWIYMYSARHWMGIDPDHAMTFMFHTSTGRNGDVLAELWLFYVAMLKNIDCHTECLQIGKKWYYSKPVLISNP